MTRLSLICLGGAGTVNGSKHLLTCGDTRLLVDCGLFQGLKHLRELNWQRLPLFLADIDRTMALFKPALHKEVALPGEVRQLMSAHADSAQLMAWRSALQRAPRRVFVVYGEADASEALRERSQRELGWSACVPLPGQPFEL